MEDNPGDARLIRIKLGEYSDFPFEFTRTENLGDALTELDESHYDVVLLDLNLPDIKGKETLAIQACVGGDLAKRVAKVIAEPNAKVCLKALPPVDPSVFPGPSGHMDMRKFVKSVIAESL